jgi:hypothetical protein
MKRLRLLLVVLMSLVIPVNGFAAPPASACPMQTQDSDKAMQADEMTAMSASMSDCCLEMDKESPSGKLCKPGQACSVGWLFFALPLSFNLSPPVGRIVLTHYASPLFNGESATIWHPPRQS